MLQSPRLKDHTKTIGIDQSLCNRSYFEHKCMNNIKKIYQHAVKCDYQQNLKDIIDADMVSIPEEVTYVIPICIKPQQQSKNQVLVNHSIYSPTYLMLNIKQQTFCWS